MRRILIQADPFDPSAEQQYLCALGTGVGAVVSFVGLMRDFDATGKVERMLLEHYPGMTDQALTEIAGQAAERWSLAAITLIHRVGMLYPGDPIVYVGVASAHRAEAFRGCEFIIDILKTRAPFWKKEFTPTGERWVEPRAVDTLAEQRWSDSASKEST